MFRRNSNTANKVKMFEVHISVKTDMAITETKRAISCILL